MSDHPVLRPAPPGLAPPEEPYVHAVRAGNLLLMAGQVAFDEHGTLVGAGDAAAQAEQCWRNVERILRSQGGTLRDVVKVVCLFTDIRFFASELAVRRRLFGDGPYPVATVAQVANLGLEGLLVEIDATAILPAS